jgi:hypothetical protein
MAMTKIPRCRSTDFLNVFVTSEDLDKAFESFAPYGSGVGYPCKLREKEGKLHITMSTRLYRRDFDSETLLRFFELVMDNLGEREPTVMQFNTYVGFKDCDVSCYWIPADYQKLHYSLDKLAKTSGRPADAITRPLSLSASNSMPQSSHPPIGLTLSERVKKEPAPEHSVQSGRVEKRPKLKQKLSANAMVLNSVAEQIYEWDRNKSPTPQ